MTADLEASTRVRIPRRLRDDLSQKRLEEMLGQLGVSGAYEIETESRSHGRYLIVDTPDVRHYVLLSASRADGRNAFLAQYAATAIAAYEKDASNVKRFHCLILDVSDKAVTPYQLFIYKCLRTLGIKLLNRHALQMVEPLPFPSVNALRTERIRLRERNSANQSSYFAECDEGYEIFGKVFGANGKESTLLALVLRRLVDAEKSVIFRMVEENGQDSLGAPDIELLQSRGVEFPDEPSIVMPESSRERSEEIRNQARFMYNLFEKFGEGKQCYFCEYNVESAIIAAHIHRVADIRASNLSVEEKKRQAVDGDNGFWLCRNHDKIFEDGIVYFDLQSVLQPSIRTPQQDLAEISETIPAWRARQEFRIRSPHDTARTREYLTHHRHRTQRLSA